MELLVVNRRNLGGVLQQGLCLSKFLLLTEVPKRRLPFFVFWGHGTGLCGVPVPCSSTNIGFLPRFQVAYSNCQNRSRSADVKDFRHTVATGIILTPNRPPANT